MGADKVAVGLRDGTHPNLVVGPREKAGKGSTENDVAISTSHPNADANQILLSNKALNETLWESILVSDREGGVLSVSIQGNHTWTALSQLYQSITIYLTCGMLGREAVSMLKGCALETRKSTTHLVSQFVVGRFTELDSGEVNLRSIVSEGFWHDSVGTTILDEGCDCCNGFISLASQWFSVPVQFILNSRKPFAYGSGVKHSSSPT